MGISFTSRVLVGSPLGLDHAASSRGEDLLTYPEKT
jgi:hypothetical protein